MPVEIVIESPAMRRAVDLAERGASAPTTTTLLVTGETGTGKDLIARSTDTRSTRSEKLIFKAGVLPTDIQASFVGADLVLAIKGTSDSITIQDFKYLDTPANNRNPIQQVSFTGSTTVWNTTQMVTEALRGTAGADSLVGTSLNDIFSGSAGNDTMAGGGGDDTYYFGRGEGKDLIAQGYDTRATRAETLIFKTIPFKVTAQQP